MDDSGRSKGPVNDASGSATGTSAIVLAADAYRKVILMQNLDIEASIWVNFGAPATNGPGSFQIPPMQTMKFDAGFCVTSSINVISGDEGLAAFTLKSSS